MVGVNVKGSIDKELFKKLFAQHIKWKAASPGVGGIPIIPMPAEQMLHIDVAAAHAASEKTIPFPQPAGFAPTSLQAAVMSSRRTLLHDWKHLYSSRETNAVPTHSTQSPAAPLKLGPAIPGTSQPEVQRSSTGVDLSAAARIQKDAVFEQPSQA
jgi:hypothetical protein